MDNLAQLTSEQEQLVALVGEFRRLATLTKPPERAALTELRWRFARTLLRHLPHKDRAVYARLRRHPNPAVAAIAERYSTEAHAMYQRFERHSARWTPEEVEAHWDSYRFGVIQLTDMLHERIGREATELLPHLATAPEVAVTRGAADRNWAGDAWKIRGQLGVA